MTKHKRYLAFGKDMKDFISFFETEAEFQEDGYFQEEYTTRVIELEKKHKVHLEEYPKSLLDLLLDFDPTIIPSFIKTLGMHYKDGDEYQGECLKKLSAAIYFLRQKDTLKHVDLVVEGLLLNTYYSDYLKKDNILELLEEQLKLEKRDGYVENE